MRLKYIIILTLLVILGGISKGFAQQAPQYTQYFFNQLGINPAYAGTQNQICITSLHRQQWADFEGPEGEKGPETTVGTIHSNLNNDYVQGVGLHFLHDELGFINNMAFSLSAAHRILLGPGELRVGINGGVFQRAIDGDFRPPDGPESIPLDDAIPDDGEASSFVPDFGFGLHYQTQGWYVGLSSQHLHEPDFDWGGAENKIYRAYYLTGGYDFILTQNLTLRPQSLIKADRAKIQVDVTATALLGDRLWGGVGYRYEDAITAHIGLRLIDNLRLGYAYDYTTSEISEFSAGTHEFMLSYCFRIQIRDEQPIIIRTPRFM